MADDGIRVDSVCMMALRRKETLEMLLKRFGICLLAIGMFIGACLPAAAAESPVLRRIVETGTIRIGVSGAQAPLNARTRSGELIGLEIDLAKFLGESLGVEVEFVLRPFPELLNALKNSEVDIVMSGMSITAERSLEAVFVGPYMMSGKSILTTSRSLASITSAADLNRSNLRVAALRNSTSAKFVEKRLPDAKLVTVENYDAAIEQLLKGDIDAMVADLPACIFAALRHPDELLTLPAPLTVEPIGIAVPASELPLQMLLDSYLSAFADSGLLEMLRVEWLEKDDWIGQIP
jgi:polar amino acid transport system substrate-binding protein